jgi:hypothetical protein
MGEAHPAKVTSVAALDASRGPNSKRARLADGDAARHRSGGDHELEAKQIRILNAQS